MSRGHREVGKRADGMRRESRKIVSRAEEILWEPGVAPRGLCSGLDRTGVACRPEQAAELGQRKPLKGGRERPDWLLRKPQGLQTNVRETSEPRGNHGRIRNTNCQEPGAGVDGDQGALTRP